jgi:hypothetical protein
MDPILFIALPALGVACYLLGYLAAETRERRAKAVLDANLKLAIRQKREMSEWIKANWPNEYTAYREGHTLGYQQGVLQGPELGGEA